MNDNDPLNYTYYIIVYVIKRWCNIYIGCNITKRNFRMKNKNLDYSQRFISFKLIEFQSIFRDTRFIFPFAIFYCFEYFISRFVNVAPEKIENHYSKINLVPSNADQKETLLSSSIIDFHWQMSKFSTFSILELWFRSLYHLSTTLSPKLFNRLTNKSAEQLPLVE